MNYFKFTIAICLLVFSTPSFAQELNLDSFVLRAHYELESDGIDVQENYDSINLDTPIFSLGGIFSRGCYILDPGFGDSCLISTPEIYALGGPSIAIQLDFRLNEFGEPIFIAGRSARYLGLETNDDELLFLRINNYGKIVIEDVFLEKDIWYNATLVHFRHDSITEVYLDDELILSHKERLNYTYTDSKISNTNFSNSTVFHGYWKDLKVYSTNINTSTESFNGLTNPYTVYPNPTTSFLNIKGYNLQSDINYSITDMNSRLIENSKLNGNQLDIQDLQSGIYILTLYEKDDFLSRMKFIKN